MYVCMYVNVCMYGICMYIYIEIVFYSDGSYYAA